MYTGTIQWQSLFWLNDNVCYVLSFKSFFHGTFILRMFDLYWWFLIFLLQAVLLKNCMLTVNLHFSDSKCKCLFLHETWKQTTVVYVKTQNSEHLSLVIAPHSYLVFCSSVSSGPVLCEVHQNSLCVAGSEQAVTVHKTWGIHFGADHAELPLLSVEGSRDLERIHLTILSLYSKWDELWLFLQKHSLGSPLTILGSGYFKIVVTEEVYFCPWSTVC